MSSMAKIFVVVNLLLGVAAFGSAATLLGAQNDYRAALEIESQALKDLQLEKKQLEDTHNADMRSQQQSASDAINLKNTAEQQNESLRTQLADAKNANDVLRRSLDTLTQQVQRLTDTIENGGAQYGGVMPGFGAVLDAEQQLAIVAYIQSWWSDETYQRWAEIDGRDD